MELPTGWNSPQAITIILQGVSGYLTMMRVGAGEQAVLSDREILFLEAVYQKFQEQFMSFRINPASRAFDMAFGHESLHRAIYKCRYILRNPTTYLPNSKIAMWAEGFLAELQLDHVPTVDNWQEVESTDVTLKKYGEKATYRAIKYARSNAIQWILEVTLLDDNGNPLPNTLPMYYKMHDAEKFYEAEFEFIYYHNFWARDTQANVGTLYSHSETFDGWAMQMFEVSPINPQRGFIPQQVFIPIEINGRKSIQVGDSKFEANEFKSRYERFKPRLKYASDDRIFNLYEGGLGISLPVSLERIDEKRNAQGQTSLVTNTFTYDASNGQFLGWTESPYLRPSSTSLEGIQDTLRRWNALYGHERYGRDAAIELTCVSQAIAYLATLQGLTPNQMKNLIQQGSRHGRPDFFLQMQGCNGFTYIGEALGDGEYSNFDPDFPEFYAAKRNEYAGIVAELGIAMVNTGESLAITKTHRYGTYLLNQEVWSETEGLQFIHDWIPASQPGGETLSIGQMAEEQRIPYVRRFLKMGLVQLLLEPNQRSHFDDMINYILDIKFDAQGNPNLGVDAIRSFVDIIINRLNGKQTNSPEVKAFLRICGYDETELDLLIGLLQVCWFDIKIIDYVIQIKMPGWDTVGVWVDYRPIHSPAEWWLAFQYQGNGEIIKHLAHLVEILNIFF